MFLPRILDRQGSCPDMEFCQKWESLLMTTYYWTRFHILTRRFAKNGSPCCDTPPHKNWSPREDQASSPPIQSCWLEYMLQMRSRRVAGRLGRDVWLLHVLAGCIVNLISVLKKVSSLVFLQYHGRNTHSKHFIPKRINQIVPSRQDVFWQVTKKKYTFQQLYIDPL